MFDLDKRKLFLTRDVVSKEEIFHFLISDQNKEGKKKLKNFNCETKEIISNKEDDEPLYNDDGVREEKQEIVGKCGV